MRSQTCYITWLKRTEHIIPSTTEIEIVALQCLAKCCQLELKMKFSTARQSSWRKYYIFILNIAIWWSYIGLIEVRFHLTHSRIFKFVIIFLLGLVKIVNLELGHSYPNLMTAHGPLLRVYLPKEYFVYMCVMCMYMFVFQSLCWYNLCLWVWCISIMNMFAVVCFTSRKSLCGTGCIN